MAALQVGRPAANDSMPVQDRGHDSAIQLDSARSAVPDVGTQRAQRVAVEPTR